METQTTPDQPELETFGQRLSDRIAAFGGSWTFIIIAITLLVGWTLINTFVLAPRQRAFDPYPFVFLNLLLSMLAALQAPVIMMSQNRQTERDRRVAAEDLTVNERTASELDAMRAQLAALRDTQWKELVSLQHEQMRILERLAEAQSAPRSSTTAAPDV